MLHDKARFHESAREHGWPVPNGVVVRDLADVPRIASLRLPMILKPADKRRFHEGKLASSPPGTGSTAFCTAAVNDELERTTKDFLDQVNYFGFGGVEYKRNARNGRFLIIEPTVGRTDWQEEAVTLAGVNIPVIAYRHELGLPPLPAGPVNGRVVWQGSWIERIRFGAKSIPPRSVVVEASGAGTIRCRPWRIIPAMW